MRDRTRRAIVENVAVALGAVALAALVAWAAGCRATPADPIRDILARAAEPEHAAPGTLRAMLDTATATSGPGIIREVYGPGVCRSAGGVNPLWRRPKPWLRARAGQWVDLHADTRAGSPPAPPATCWLVLSYDAPLPTPVDFSAYGMPGCHLLVRPEYVVAVPESAEPIGRHPDFAVWRWAGTGHVEVRWRPSAPGLRLSMQLLVAAPGENRAGFLTSQALEIQVDTP